MIVELAGLPGTGKSSIACLLETSERTIRRQVIGAQRRTMIRHAAGTVIHSIRPLGMGRGTGWPAWPRLWLRWHTQNDMTNTVTGIDLLEEGTTHHTWRTLYRHPRLLHAPWPVLLDLPHPLFLLEAPRELREDRVASKRRGGPVNRTLAGDQHGAAWDVAEALLDRIIAAIPSTRTVIRVDTSGALHTVVARVMTEIKTLLSDQRQQAHAQR